MTELELLKQKLEQLRLIPHPDLKLTTAIWQIEQLIEERERKLKVK